MAELISNEVMYEALEWAYDKSIQGIPGMGSATELAEDYMKEKGSLEDKINALIRWQNTKAGSAGFLAGLGGMITLPVALPANIASTLYVQIRMIAAIAHMTGHDIKHDKVKTLIFLCLLGNSMNEVAKDFGISFGTKFATSYIQKNITREMLVKINKAVGFLLVTKTGSKGLINLTKVVPILGGVIGGGLDAITTNIIGNQARDLFLKIDKMNFEKDLRGIKNVTPNSNKTSIVSPITYITITRDNSTEQNISYKEKTINSDTTNSENSTKEIEHKNDEKLDFKGNVNF